MSNIHTISFRTRETSDDRGGLVRRDGVKLLCSHVAVVVFTLSFEWTETYCRRWTPNKLTTQTGTLKY